MLEVLISVLNFVGLYRDGIRAFQVFLGLVRGERALLFFTFLGEVYKTKISYQIFLDFFR